MRTAPARYRVTLARPQDTHTAPGGPRTADQAGPYTYLCTRRKADDGDWWYRICGPERSTHVGEWMKPMKGWTVEVIR